MARSSLAAAAVLAAWVGGGEDGAGREGGGDEDEAGGLHWARLTTFFTVLRGREGPTMTTLQAGLKNQAHAGLEEAAFFFLLKKLGI